MPLSGTFSSMPFADLLQWLGDSRRSGTVSVALEFEERYIRFERGQIAAYGSDDPMARDIGRVALQRGLLDDAAMLRAVEKQTRNHMPLADVLQAEGLVEAEALERAVRAHVEETVLGLFLWPEGRFTFIEAGSTPTPEEDAWMPPEYQLAEPLDVREILMEGMRRLDEWTRIVKVLPSDDVQLHALGPAEDLPILEDIAAHPEPPTLGDLLAERGDSRYPICEQLFRAFERGLLAVEAGRERDTKTARGATTVAHLVRAAENLIVEEQYDEAATLLRSALNLDPFRSEARGLLRRVREAQLKELYESMPRDRVPVLGVAPARLGQFSLAPRERKLLEQVNGRWDVSALTLTTALGELETLRALRRLVHAGVVRLDKRR
jgi:hypothetical protein